MSRPADALADLVRGALLDPDASEQVMGEVLDGKCAPEHVAALLSVLAFRGESADELVGFARAMRARATPVSVPDAAIDTCGTGGSGIPTVNTSTLVAFALAAAGVPVAKHGNRASSGLCGSGDVLDRAGVSIDVAPDRCSALIDEVGIAFLFAPLFHPAMRTVGPVRRTLGFRTVFNFLGPLCNPAGVCRQLLGVSSREHAPRMAEALRQLGAESAIVAAGADGLDEITLAGATDLWILEDGRIREERVTPEDFGVSAAPLEDFAGGGPEENLRIFDALLDGAPGPHADHLAINVAAGLRVAGRASNWREGTAMARELLESGAVRACFDHYRSSARRMAA